MQTIDPEALESNTVKAASVLLAGLVKFGEITDAQAFRIANNSRRRPRSPRQIPRQPNIPIDPCQAVKILPLIRR